MQSKEQQHLVLIFQRTFLFGVTDSLAVFRSHGGRQVMAGLYGLKVRHEREVKRKDDKTTITFLSIKEAYVYFNMTRKQRQAHKIISTQIFISGYVNSQIELEIKNTMIKIKLYMLNLC